MTNTVVLLLTGGRSHRFGADKLAAEINGRRVVDYVIDTIVSSGLEGVTYEVGRSYSDFAKIDGTELNDPLAAIGQAWKHLTANQNHPPLNALLLAGDSVNLDPSTLSFLYSFPGDFNVVPHDNGTQPLCARWSSRSLGHAVTLNSNRRNLAIRSALCGPTISLTDTEWLNDSFSSPFLDVDTPEDLQLATRLLSNP